jgi:hypothetical protein
MPGFDVRDSGCDERVFDEWGSHIERVKMFSHHGQFAGGDGSTGAVREPTSVSIKMGNELLRSGAKYKDRNETNRRFWYK